MRHLAQLLWWAEHDYGQAPGADWADVGGERRERLYDRARFALSELAPAIRAAAVEEFKERELRERLEKKIAAWAADPTLMHAEAKDVLLAELDSIFEEGDDA